MMNARAWFYSQPGFHDHSPDSVIRGATPTVPDDVNGVPSGGPVSDQGGASRTGASRHGEAGAIEDHMLLDTLAIIEAWAERVATGAWTPEQLARAVRNLLRGAR